MNKKKTAETLPLQTGRVREWIEADIARIEIPAFPPEQRTQVCRLFGMNAPAPLGSTIKVAAQARMRAEHLTLGKELSFSLIVLPDNILIPPRFRAYGRTMVRIFLPDGRELAELLVDEGLAVPYFMGLGRQPAPTGAP